MLCAVSHNSTDHIFFLAADSLVILVLNYKTGLNSDRLWIGLVSHSSAMAGRIMTHGTVIRVMGDVVSKRIAPTISWPVVQRSDPRVCKPLWKNTLPHNSVRTGNFADCTSPGTVIASHGLRGMKAIGKTREAPEEVAICLLGQRGSNRGNK
ncbi:uncharacterized protein BO97DRAFT_65396 [Aspergillus homomorphus CBS 101889]|uniref:Uncharacterized protein n=1 Tax=Aspergillus homomorphus (strain CBS 101889) TaxID=1450537 RepID=A0A395HWX8_ASPHC|nr:hypothetical protein BO97DRAFT_65396 [Aspergillus homomorphus CBS 101889]RAL12297.1 hypothetical protein BO97DRAFT_65396 [Aspergillus homomorphus CBS 101889]